MERVAALLYSVLRPSSSHDAIATTATTTTISSSSTRRTSSRYSSSSASPSSSSAAVAPRSGTGGSGNGGSTAASLPLSCAAAAPSAAAVPETIATQHMQQRIELAYHALPEWLSNRRLVPYTWRQLLKGLQEEVEFEALHFFPTGAVPPTCGPAFMFFATHRDDLHYLTISQLVQLLEQKTEAAGSVAERDNNPRFSLFGLRRGGEITQALQRWRALRNTYEKENLHLLDMHSVLRVCRAFLLWLMAKHRTRRQLCRRLQESIPASQRSLQNKRKQLQDCAKREKEVIRAAREAQRAYATLCDAYGVPNVHPQQTQQQQQQKKQQRPPPHGPEGGELQRQQETHQKPKQQQQHQQQHQESTQQKQEHTQQQQGHTQQPQEPTQQPQEPTQQQQGHTQQPQEHTEQQQGHEEDALLKQQQKHIEEEHQKHTEKQEQHIEKHQRHIEQGNKERDSRVQETEEQDEQNRKGQGEKEKKVINRGTEHTVEKEDDTSSATRHSPAIQQQVFLVDGSNSETKDVGTLDQLLWYYNHHTAETEEAQQLLQQYILLHVESTLPKLLHPAEMLLRTHGLAMADCYAQFCEYYHGQKQQQHQHQHIGEEEEDEDEDEEEEDRMKMKQARQSIQAEKEAEEDEEEEEKKEEEDQQQQKQQQSGITTRSQQVQDPTMLVRQNMQKPGELLLQEQQQEQEQQQQGDVQQEGHEGKQHRDNTVSEGSPPISKQLQQQERQQPQQQQKQQRQQQEKQQRQENTRAEQKQQNKQARGEEEAEGEVCEERGRRRRRETLIVAEKRRKPLEVLRIAATLGNCTKQQLVAYLDSNRAAVCNYVYATMCARWDANDRGWRRANARTAAARGAGGRSAKASMTAAATEEEEEEEEETREEKGVAGVAEATNAVAGGEEPSSHDESLLLAQQYNIEVHEVGEETVEEDTLLFCSSSSNSNSSSGDDYYYSQVAGHDVGEETVVEKESLGGQSLYYDPHRLASHSCKERNGNDVKNKSNNTLNGPHSNRSSSPRTESEAGTGEHHSNSSRVSVQTRGDDRSSSSTSSGSSTGIGSSNGSSQRYERGGKGGGDNSSSSSSLGGEERGTDMKRCNNKSSSADISSSSAGFASSSSSSWSSKELCECSSHSSSDSMDRRTVPKTDGMTGKDVCLFEHRVLRHLLLQDIYELHAFLFQRLREEKDVAAEREEGSAYSTGFFLEIPARVDALPPGLNTSSDQLREWLHVAERLAELLGGRETLQLLLLQSNPKSLERLLEKFAAARRKLGRYASDVRQLLERTTQLHKEMEVEQQKLAALKAEARTLRAALESQSPTRLPFVRFTLVGIPADKLQ